MVVRGQTLLLININQLVLEVNVISLIRASL